MQILTSLGSSYRALLYIITVIPASLFMPLKVCAVIWIFSLAFKEYVWSEERVRVNRLELSVLLAYGCSILFLCALTIYLGEVEIQSILSATARYIVVIALTFLGMLLVRSGHISCPEILHTIFFGHFIYLLIKIFSMLLARYFQLETDQILELSTSIIPRATDHGFSGDSNFVRIFIGNDAISPTILAVYFLHFRGHSRMQPIWGSFFITCALIASVLTFTRFVWVSLFVVLFLQGWSSARFFSLTAFYRSSVMAFVTIIVVAYILGFLDGGSVGSAAAERSADTGSLEEKLIQIKLMWAAFTEHPIFGTGIGSHLELHASTSEISYSYEAQWFSLLMQLGLIGTLPLLVVATTPLWPLLNRARNNGLDFYSIFLIVSYGIWLLGSLTNPYLFILSSTAVYLSVLMCSIDIAYKYPALTKGSS